MEDQKEHYQMHLQRIKNAKSRVDSHAPVQRKKGDAHKMHLSYMEMLTALYRRNSKTFTKVRENELRSDRRSLTDDKAAGDSLKDLDIPYHILKRYEKIMLSLDQQMIQKLLRPMVFLDVELKNVRYLGRLTIQFYTEACPAIVLEFIRICSRKLHQNFSIQKISLPIWIDGSLSIEDNNNIMLPNLEVDMNALDHGTSPGVLSFPSRYVRGNPNNYILFSISLEAMKTFNGRRIAFGKIIRGLPILAEIKRYATAHNKTARDILITKCGMI